MVRIVTWSALALLGGAAFFLALQFERGYGPQIGSAQVPLVMAGGLVLVAGLGLLTSPDEAEAPIALRPFLAVTGGVLAFVLTVDWLGLIPAALLTMLASYLGQTERAYLGFGLFALLFALGVWLLFSVGLGMPVAAFGGR